ncbi:MAG TPA: glycosyltransferase [Nitrospiraceae bacterium]|nr:glycosyltransferase [Nitrospiraceae bacterium]
MGVLLLTPAASPAITVTRDMDRPMVSIVIPTHNRQAMLRRTLTALGTQTYHRALFEVVVVADGCTDGTAEMLRGYSDSLTLRFIEQACQGAAAARNNGAHQASGALLLFLDDDVEPSPGLVEAHVAAHQSRSGRIVMGPYVPFVHGRSDFFHMLLRSWWHDKFRTINEPGHRYTYEDLLTGNLSIDAELFARTGGFDSAIRSAGREDYEFGARLIKAGVPFSFAPEALAYHHEDETTDIDRALQRSRHEGHADVLIGQRHADLRPTLRLVHFGEPTGVRDFLVHAMAFRYPGLGDRLAGWLRQALRIFESLRLRRMWRFAFTGLRHYWYLRGVVDTLGSPKALMRFLQGGPAHSHHPSCDMEIDLRDGLEAVERRVNDARPAGLRVRYGKHAVGRIPPQAGAERLRGPHLRHALATTLSWELWKAVVMESASAGSGVLPSFCGDPLIGPSFLRVLHADKSL